MTNERAIMIKESERIGEKIIKEFKELDRAIEAKEISSWEVIVRLGDLNQRYDSWRQNHERLLLGVYIKPEV